MNDPMFDIMFVNDRNTVLNMLAIDGLIPKLSTYSDNFANTVYNMFERQIIALSANIFGDEFSENSGKHADGNLVCEIYMDPEIDYSDVFRNIIGTETTDISMMGETLVIIVANDGFRKLYPKDLMVNQIVNKLNCSYEIVSDIYNAYNMSIWINNPGEKIMSYVKDFRTFNDDNEVMMHYNGKTK